LEIVRKRTAKPPIQLPMGPTITLGFTKFDPLRNEIKEKDRPVKVPIPQLPSNQVMGVTKDTLPQQSWLDEQSKFIKGLDEYDYMTVMSYTVRSHQWIGPWMRTRNINQVRFTQPYGFMTPLYPQIKSLYQKIPAQNRTSLQNNIINSYMYYTGYIKYLPKDDIKKALDMYIEDLQRIIKKAPKLNRTMYVYRGLDRDIFKGKLGTVHTLDYFSSTGYVPQRVYAPQYYMRIKLLKGTRVLLLQGLNDWSYAGEFEVLLNKGSKFVITKRNLKRSVVNNKNAVMPKQKFVTDVTVYN
jgi:hypothetical protein